MGQFSLAHILIVGLILLLFFGPTRLPQLGQSLGKAIRGFKDGLSEIDVDAKDVHDTPKQAASEQIVQTQTQTHSQPNTQTTSQTKVETVETIKKS